MCLSIAVNYPDRVLATGEYLGYEWNIVNNGYGNRCGYIKLPRGHPWYGRNYDNIPAEVHGGLTFAEHDKPCGKGGADDGFWIGFDCAHLGDRPDPELPAERSLCLLGLQGVVRTQEYVTKECRNLCRQAKLYERR